MVERNEFLEGLGFDEDPFAHTNADEEVSRLPEYFVEPPYFAEVFGYPDNPKSFFVFAPRGGGKTAQRIMMEKRCEESDVLCLTYTDFDVSEIRAPDKFTLAHHLDRILTIGWLGVLVALDANQSLSSHVTRENASIVVDRIQYHVCKLTRTQFREALNSLRMQSGKVHGFIQKHEESFGRLGVLLQTVLKTFHSVDLSALSSLMGETRKEDIEQKHDLALLIDVARQIGFQSIYVVVDRVDETALAGNDPEKSFKLIEPLVRSLHLLETPGIAFKFFLWDAIELYFTPEVARRDRIGYRKLIWDNESLNTLLRKRLMAFSGRTVRKLDTIAESLRPYDIDQLVLMFGNRSPRDLIRICQKILAEQQQLDSKSDILQASAIYRGVDEACKQRVEEIYEATQIKNFQRIGAHEGQVDFTVAYLSNEVFRTSSEAIRARIKVWKDERYIEDITYIANVINPQGRNVKLFGVRDIRLARVMTLSIPLMIFVSEKVKQCENCSFYLVRDWNTLDSSDICHHCGYDLVRRVEDRKFVRPSDDELLPLEALLLKVQGES